MNKVYLPDLVGKGYADFWHFKGRYRVVKGSRRSKKSKTAALWFISNLMEYPLANLLVVRNVYRTLKDSCFTELKWAINRLGVSEFWECKTSPLEMKYLPTGQKIYFRGMDDPLKITSITVEVGVLSWLWIEEAFELTNEKDFDTLIESMLGDCPDGLFKQVTLTFNPWSERHWLKGRFFDSPDDDVLAKTTNYLCNEWLSGEDLKVFEKMKIQNHKRYRVAGLGEWGIDNEGLIFQNWEERFFDIYSHEFQTAHPNVKSAFGLDFGYTNDPTALFCGLIDAEKAEIYVFDELYKKSLTNQMIAKEIKAKGYSKEKIIADSAEPKSIVELQEAGLLRVKGASKRKGINFGIQLLQGYKFIIHPKCVNFISEINNYGWSTDKFGNLLNRPIDESNHLMDAMRYAVTDLSKGDVFSFE